MKDDLKPCPFCGAKPTFKRAGEIVGISCGKETGCDNTGLFICFAADKEAEAIAAWNRRALAASTASDAQTWRERWYGSDPERGWSILQGRDVVAYIGGDESMSDAVRAIVDAHNAGIAKEPK